MNSRLFESINDRSNIINAYMKMINESSDISTDTQDHIDSHENDLSTLEGKEHPVLVYDEHYDNKWISLDEYEYNNAAQSNMCEIGSDEYYFNLAFERLGTDGVYQRLKNAGYTPSDDGDEHPDALNSEDNLHDDIVKIGKDYIDGIHQNDIEVWIPDWAASYVVNGDDSGLEEQEKAMVDEWEQEYIDQGYTFVYDGETQEMKRPDFGEMSNYAVRGYFVKHNDTKVGESYLNVNENTYHAFTVTIKNILWSTENADKAEEDDIQLPSADRINIEADSDSDTDINTAINNFYIKSYGFAPDGFDIVNKVYHGERNDHDTNARTDSGEESVPSKSLPELKRETGNEDLEVVTEEESDDVSDIYSKYMERGYLDKEEDEDDINRVLDAGFTVKNSPNGDVCYVIEWERSSTEGRFNADANESMDGDNTEVDSDYDDKGVYHEFPKTPNKINRYRQKFRINAEGASKFDDLSEELHDALDGCTRGFFTDNQYSVVQEVMNKLQSIGLFTTITKIENSGTRNSDGLRGGKKYHFDATWTNKFGKRMTVHGIVSIFFAGTVDDPERRYDACVHFFTDDGNYIRVDC